jgi:hypothetical protein
VRSQQAKRVVAELRIYFASSSQLARALGTSRDTLRAWNGSHTPARPRVELLDAAQSLLALCRAVSRYVPDKTQVGQWLESPSPRLRGVSPVEVLRSHGHNGLDLLLADLAVTTPPRPTSPIDIPSLEDLRTALEMGIGTETVQRISHAADADAIVLSDAELDAELDAVHVAGRD